MSLWLSGLSPLPSCTNTKRMDCRSVVCIKSSSSTLVVVVQINSVFCCFLSNKCYFSANAPCFGLFLSKCFRWNVKKAEFSKVVPSSLYAKKNGIKFEKKSRNSTVLAFSRHYDYVWLWLGEGVIRGSQRYTGGYANWASSTFTDISSSWWKFPATRPS